MRDSSGSVNGHTHHDSSVEALLAHGDSDIAPDALEDLSTGDEEAVRVGVFGEMHTLLEWELANGV